MNKQLGLKAIFVAALLCCSVNLAEAHKPLLAVEDNEDGTIYLEAGFSDGSSAAGHKVILTEEKTGKVIAEHTVGEDGTLEVEKPKVPYTVTLDAGEGHIVTRPGPPPSTAEQTAAKVPAQDKGTEQGTTSQSEKAAARPPAQANQPPKAAPAPKAADVSQAQPQPAGPAVPLSVVGAVSPGALMAFKMMITTQIVTATALIILLVVVVYFLGYTAGKNAAGASRRREV